MPIVRFACTAFLAFILSMPMAVASELRLETFFEGRTTAKGSFTTITGFERSFTLELHGRWDGRTLTLREDFLYDDGETDTKTWRFTQIGWNTYSGTREDVIGETTVSVIGNRGYFNYLVDLDPGPGRNVVRFYDTLTLSDDGQTLVNTANVFKGPLPVARARVTFSR